MSVSAWEPDPTGRHQYRWYDGEQWTDQVADNGIQGVDDLSSTEAKLPREARPTPPAPMLGSFTSGPTAAHGSDPSNPVTMLASGWYRFAAYLIEAGLLFVPMLIMISVTLALNADTISDSSDSWEDISWLPVEITEYITYFIFLAWSLSIYSRGQTPGKQLLKMRVVRLEQRRPANWGLMAVRQIILGGMFLSIIDLAGSEGTSVGISVIVIMWMLVNGIVLLADDKKQAVWDKILKTVVIRDPDGIFSPENH